MTGGDPFVLPVDGTLDLHAFNPRDVKSLVEEYVTEAHAAGLKEIRIIHGRGTGVLRGIVQAALEAHPLVESFWDDTDAHLGATGARLTTRDSGFGARDSGLDGS
jgi:dsDNA-specific endonuclease/ATPase MutS2